MHDMCNRLFKLFISESQRGEESPQTCLHFSCLRHWQESSCAGLSGNQYVNILVLSMYVSKPKLTFANNPITACYCIGCLQ